MKSSSKKYKIHIVVLFSILFNTISLKGQDREILNRFPIMNGDSLKGYCFAYKELKAEKDRDKYIFTIYNQDMGQSDDFILMIENDFTLDYYSENIGIKRQIEVKGNFLFLVFHKLKNKIGLNEKNKDRVFVIDLIKREIITDKIIELDFDEVNKIVFLENNRILKMSYKEKNIEVFDYSLNQISDISIPLKSGLEPFYFAGFIEINKDYLALNFTEYKDKKVKCFVWLLSLKDGKIVKIVNFLSEEKDCFYTASKFFPIGKDFLIVGYYNRYNGKKMLGVRLSDNIGFFCKKISLTEDSTFKTIQQTYSYHPFFDKLCVPYKVRKYELETSVEIEKIFVKDNKYFFLFQQKIHNGYYISSPLPILSKELTASNFLKNTFFLVEADTNLNFKSIQTLSGDTNLDNVKFDIEKNLLSESTYHYANNSLVIMSRVSADEKTPITKSKFVYVLCEKDKPIKSDEFSYSDKAEWTEFYLAKPGYIMIVEYFEKEKALKKRIEKLNY